jgi:naphtho-gamma-pyrone polyketide synthase
MSTPAKVLPAAKAKARPSPNDKILGLIAEAVGIEISDLKPDTSFDECGVDSLLSLNISKMIQDQLSLEVSSSDFAEYPTVSEFLSHVGTGSSVATSGMSTPQSSGSSTELDSLFNDKASYPSSVTSDDNELIEDIPKSTNQTMAIIRSVITKEVGLEPADMTNSTRFSDLGVDSLLTLNIMSQLGEVLDRELPSMLLAENETLDEVERALGLKSTTSQSAEPLSSKGRCKPPTAAQQPAKTESGPDATAHLLQGNARSATKKLFLFPDGSGSAFSYATLASISPSVAVYGLACPWQKDPWSMRGVSFSALSSKFISAIQKVQPHGPYHLGGWSAGGISAYDAAQQLAAMGEETGTLVLLDSPNPIGLENPPQRMYDFFDKLDSFGMGKKPPKWLHAHFDAFLTMLDAYEIAPWKKGKLPKTHIIYAKDGVCSNLKPGDPQPEIRDDDPREMKWLMNTRTDFGADGWKSLVGPGNVDVEVLEQVNHFSMMNKGPKSGELAAFMKKALV